MEKDRRQFLAATAGGLLAIPQGQVFAGDQEPAANEPENEVDALEDLMREHGILNRILLIYEEGMRRLDDKVEAPPEVFHKPAMLVRKFVEDYHEKLEENFIFPEFEKRRTSVDLVRILREQHQAGRKVTDVILRTSASDVFRKEEARKELVSACRAFIRMYRPHEAREDTVLFPALHKLIPAKQMQDLGEQFESEEDRLFGDEGFQKTVEQVATIEKQLGINDLSLFTPH